MSILPPLPPVPPSNLLLFSGQQWTWLTRSLTAIYAAQDTQLKVLGAITTSLEGLHVAQQDLQTALDRLTADVASAQAAISSEIADLKAALAALSTSKAPTQAQLDQLNAAADVLETATASLSADDANAPPSP